MPAINRRVAVAMREAVEQLLRIRRENRRAVVKPAPRAVRDNLDIRRLLQRPNKGADRFAESRDFARARRVRRALLDAVLPSRCRKERVVPIDQHQIVLSCQEELIDS